MNVFNVGDKARIRKDLKARKFYNTSTGTSCFCNESMTTYGGTAVVVEQKTQRTGFMELRTIGDGASMKIPWDWSDAMLEPLEESDKSDSAKPKPKFKIGDKVVIRTTVSAGERIDGITIQPFMFEQAYSEDKCRIIGTIKSVINGGTSSTVEVDFHSDDGICFTWPTKALELYHRDNQSGASKKKQKRQVAKADYSGYTPKSEFYCYDYLNRKATFCKGAMKNITKIEITVMSGDETGCFYGVCNGEPWQYRFDTMTTSRFQSYDDGSYTVEGRENIEKWLTWSYDSEKAIYAEYSMERMRAFNG